MTNIRKIMITSALPYANGATHLGHMVEFVQTDIWYRFQKLRGHQAFYICGDDAHGSAIMLRAEKEGITSEALVKRVHAERLQDFSGFYVEFDSYYTTHSEENRILSCEIYKKLRDRGDIIKKTIDQAYDPEKNIFLPDRFIKGDCPRCGASDQYGDNCEVCGATYTPTELKNPRSVISGATPIQKASEHYFFELPKYEAFLRAWSRDGGVCNAVANKLDEWFTSGLHNWDISRDAPYFGFEIPDAPNKYFYVWLDAPIGYMASFKHLCEQRNDLDFNEFWKADSKTELHHFIGKDIMYFHTLFWPAMLHGANYRLPTAVHTHGFLTVNGQKMSKSRGTFIKASTYLEHLDPEWLRYYYATKLNDSVEDMDLNFEDFRLKVNSDLVGKYVNIASRCAGFITKKFEGLLSDYLPEPELLAEFQGKADIIADFYEARDYSRAMREIMLLADRANQYVAEKAPWTLSKDETKSQEIQLICSQAINMFRILTIYLQPVLPRLAHEVEKFLGVSSFQWNDYRRPLLAHRINTFVPLMQRVEETQIIALQEASRGDIQ